MDEEKYRQLEEKYAELVTEYDELKNDLDIAKDEIKDLGRYKKFVEKLGEDIEDL